MFAIESYMRHWKVKKKKDICNPIAWEKGKSKNNDTKTHSEHSHVG